MGESTLIAVPHRQFDYVTLQRDVSQQLALQQWRSEILPIRRCIFKIGELLKHCGRWALLALSAILVPRPLPFATPAAGAASRLTPPRGKSQR